MIKLKEIPAAFERQNAINQIKADLDTLPSKIKEIKSYEVGVNINPNPLAYEIVLISEFDNFNDLNIYREHPEHVKVLELIGKYKDNSVFNDYIF
jgi:hypothetical protein